MVVIEQRLRSGLTIYMVLQRVDTTHTKSSKHSHIYKSGHQLIFPLSGLQEATVKGHSKSPLRCLKPWKPRLTWKSILFFCACRRGLIFKLCQKWYELSTNFFLSMKLWCLQLHLALILYQCLDYARNGSLLKKVLKQPVSELACF